MKNNIEQIRKTIEDSISEFLADGGKLCQSNWRLNNYCCALGAVIAIRVKNRLIRWDGVTSYSLYISYLLDLDIDKIEAFIDGWDGNDDFEVDSSNLDFYQLGLEFQKKYQPEIIKG